MLVLQVSVRVVPESLILLLFDQIVPMLASPHWRLLFSSCNTSITTTTTTLLRICFVPICFLAWKIIAREVLFFLAKTKVSQLHSRSNVRRNVIPMTSTTWSDFDSDQAVAIPWATATSLAMFSRNYYYLRLRRHSTDPSLEIKLEILMIANYFRDANSTRRSNGYNYYFSRFLLRFINDRFQFGWKAVLKSWWQQLWQSPTTLLLLLLLLLPLLKLPSSYKSFEYSTTYNLPTRSTYHPTLWAVVLSPVWKSVRTYANCYYYYDPHSPPMWSNLYLIWARSVPTSR